MAQTRTASDAPPLKRLSAILGGSAGNLVEWYDWFAYAAFSLYFAKVFFPKGDATAQLLQTAAVFAVGFLARPVGAWVMGIYADRAGRRMALSVSVAMMCLGSLVVAVVPGAKTIGVAAPIMLTLARILQGLSVGGEYGASATYMSEMAGRGRRGFWSSFQYVTIIAGQLIALGVLIALQHLLSPQALDAWGWRVPFAIGAVLAVVVFWIQLGLDETDSFQAVQGEAAQGEPPRSKTMLLFLDHPRETAIIFALTSAGSLTFYAFTTYMQKFLTNTAHFSKPVGANISAFTLIWYMLAQPLFGWLADRVGRRLLLAGSFATMALLTWPILTLLSRQRRGEGRAVSHRGARAGRRPALRHRQRGVRRHGGVRRRMVQAGGHGVRVLHLRQRDLRRRLHRRGAHARHPGQQPHPGGLGADRPPRPQGSAFCRRPRLWATLRSVYCAPSASAG